jgi:hypothetical protein
VCRAPSLIICPGDEHHNLQRVTRVHAPRQVGGRTFCMAGPTWSSRGSTGGARSTATAGEAGRRLPERPAPIAVGESVIKCPSLLNVLKYTCDHSCY